MQTVAQSGSLKANGLNQERTLRGALRYLKLHRIKISVMDGKRDLDKTGYVVTNKCKFILFLNFVVLASLDVLSLHQ